MPGFSDEINTKLLGICPPGTELYIVGGYIRDILMQNDCIDRDYAVKGSPAIKFARKAAGLLNGTFVPLDKKNDIARVVLPDKTNTLDFAGCVGRDIYTDLANRDYTINAMACRLVYNTEYELTDPYNGQKDIENRTVRAICENNLKDDPLRLLRAFRLAARFNFIIEEKTLELIAAHCKLINNVAAERVNAEIIKLLESENAFKNLVLMKNTGILFEIFPELAPQKDVPPNLHHHLWLIDHSIETVRQVEAHVADFHFSGENLAILKLAALLHDVGKPATWSIDEKGKHRFIKHEEVGSEMALELMKRLKFSRKDARHLSLLVKNHLYPSQLIREGIDNLSDRAVMRFFRKINDYVPELLLLALADRKSARGPEVTDETVKNNTSGIYTLLDKYRQAGKEVKELPKLASGRDVMEILRIGKGPEVGKVLRDLKEAQISGEVNTREEALEFIKSSD